MRTKIVGIVILMLVATTVVSATNINVKEKIQPTSSSVDVPVYKVGDSWTYDYHRMEYRYNGSTLWYTQYSNFTYTVTVTDTTGENYTLKLTSKNVEGRVIIGSYRLKYTALTKATDVGILRKTDLATYHETWGIKGPVFWLIGSIGLPFPAQYQQAVTMSFTTPHVQLPFPFTAGVSGTLPGYSFTIQEKQSLYWGLITLFNNPEKPYTGGPLPYQCEMANVTVPAGTYNTYNVSVDFPIGIHGHYSFWQYYVPEVGNDVKSCVYQTTGGGKPVYNIEGELVSTTYTP